MQTIHLNSNNFRLFPRVYMVQNDTGRDLKMVLDDITLAGTETGAVAIKRSDGSYYTISATLVSADNAFTADMTQALTQPGLTECQLKVTASDDTVVSSYTFVIFVQPSTDGISEEQLGYSVQDVIQAAQDIMSGGLSSAFKTALLNFASKVSYIDENGQSYYDALYDSLYPSVDSLSVVYTQSGVVYSTDTLDDLRDDLVVTATYTDGSSETVSDYTLSGTLTPGTSTITVEYHGATTTFTVTVTAVIEVELGLNVYGNGAEARNTTTSATDIIPVAESSEQRQITITIGNSLYMSAVRVLNSSKSYIGSATRNTYTAGEGKFTLLANTAYIRVLILKDYNGSVVCSSSDIEGTSIVVDGDSYVMHTKTV